jgi:hypothetical protein
MVETVGIGVFWDGSHVGVLHRQPEGLRILHLCRHNDLRNLAPRGNELAFWIIPDLAPEILNGIAAQCRLFAAVTGRQEFPYGFSSPKGFFKNGIPNDFQKLDNGRLGLTCASLVLAVFDSTGASLVRYWTWAIRKEDKAKREELVRNMFAKMGPKHAAAVLVEVGPRYQPLEVAGSVVCGKPPISFGTAIATRRQLEAFLKANPGP